MTTSVWVELQFTPKFITEHLNSGFEPRVFHQCTFCKASTTKSTLFTGLFVLVNINLNGDIHLISFKLLESRFIRYASDLSHKSQP